jgi:hypothetical protein
VTLIIQVPRGGAVDRQLGAQAPHGAADAEVIVESHPDPPEAGSVVMSVPSPETLAREADEVRRVIERAGAGVEPLVVVVEAADELRDDELAPLLAAAARATRAVILRVLRDG